MSDYIAKECFPGLKHPPTYCIRKLPDVAYEQFHFFLAIRGKPALSDAEYLKYFTLCGSRSTMMAFASGKTQVSFLKSAMIIHTLNFAFLDLGMNPYEPSAENLEVIQDAQCLLSLLSNGMGLQAITSKCAPLSPVVHPNGEITKERSSSVSLPKPIIRRSVMPDSGLRWPENVDPF
jgi:hypothetical protein